MNSEVLMTCFRILHFVYLKDCEELIFFFTGKPSHIVHMFV